MEGQITDRTRNYLARFFSNTKELDTFLGEHEGESKDELFRLASMGKGKGKSHISGKEEETLKSGFGAGISHRTNRNQNPRPFKLNLPPR